MLRPMIRAAALVCAASGVLATSASAQSAAAAPASERWVGINAYPLPEGPAASAPEGKKIIRRAELVEEPETLLRLTDAFVATWPGGSALPGGMTLTVPVGADGKLGKCTVELGRSVTEADGKAACDAVTSRATILPALLFDGTTLADSIEVSILLHDQVPFNPALTGPVRRGYVARTLAEPGPPPSGNSWPFRQHFRFWQKPAKTRIAAERGLTAPLAPGTPWVGAFLGDGSRYTPACFKTASSGDKAFAEGACDLAVAALKPKWSGSGDPNNRSYPYLIVKDGDGVRIVEPGFAKGLEPVIPDTERARLAARVAAFPAPRPAVVAIRIGPDGRVKSCEITRSSTVDRTDFRTCRILLDEAQFVPGRDIYGMGMGQSVILRL